MSLNSGATPFKPVLLSLRFHGQRGKPTRAILWEAPTIEAVTTAWPGVASFDVIEDVERSKPSPEPMPDEEAEALAAQLEADGFSRPEAERLAREDYARRQGGTSPQAEAEPPPQSEEKPQRATGP